MDDELLLPFTVHLGYDLAKSTSSPNADGPEDRLFEGTASLETPDLEDETLIQKGMNLKPFLDFGHINYDHGTVLHRSPAYIVGEPIEASITRVPSRTHGTVDGLYVKGRIYNVPGHKQLAHDCWDHMVTLSKSQGSHRRMGASIEGKARLRQGRKIVTASDIYNMALTPAPMHPDTHMGISGMQKSLAAIGQLGVTPFLGHGVTLNEIAEAIRKSDTGVIGDLDQDGTRDKATIGGYRDLLKEDLEHAKGHYKRGQRGRLKGAIATVWGTVPCTHGCYNGMGRFAKGRDGARDHLIKCQGWHPDEADALVHALDGIFGK